MQGVWAEKKFYAQESGNKTIILMYDNVPAGKPYFSNGKWVELINGAETETNYISDITNVTIGASCGDYNGTTLEYLFSGFHSLKKISGLGTLVTEKITDMDFMFNECRSLTSFDFSKFNTSNVKDMSYMFSGCSSLTSLNFNNLNTANVFKMEYMFGGCSALTTLDLSNFNTANVIYMDGMFSGCSALTKLDLSSFKTSKVITDVSSMFWGCSELTTIIVGDGWKESLIIQGFVDRSNTFYNCSKLPGYDGGAIDASKAHTGTDGYLTMMLNETDDNSSWISEHNGQKHRVMLKRTLKAGSYNTFSVPFFMNAIPEGWKAKELDTDYNYTKLQNGTLTLAFIAAGASRIQPNRAYLVKVNADVVNPAFSDVTISNTNDYISTVSNVVRFMPTSFGKTTLTDAKENILFLAEGDKLKHPSEAGQSIKGFRGYFLLLGNAAHARTFHMDFGDGETTSVNEELRIKNEESAAAQWYTLDGVRLSGKPSSKGIYIVNGKKIVIK